MIVGEIMSLNGLFGPPKSKRLARIVSISSPSAYNESVNILRRGGLTHNERQALLFARTRAMLQLRRKNLSSRERLQFKKIVRTKL